MKLSAGSRAFLVLVLLVVLVGVVSFLLSWMMPALVSRVSADAIRVLTSPYFYLGRLPVTPAFLFKALLFLLLIGALARATREFLKQRVLPHTSMDIGQQYALARFTGYFVFVIGLLIGLQSAGLNLSSLALIGGALGIGIGFGLQPIVANFVAGLILLAERPVKVGDRIEIGGTLGNVIRIRGRATWVRTNDNFIIVVPNSEFINNRVTNWTANDRQVRYMLPLGVSYSSDPEQVRDVLLAVARRHPDVLADPGPEVLFTGFGDSALNFSLRVWTLTRVETPRGFISELYFEIFRAFREQKIEIPFPQRDLHLKSVAAPLTIRQA